MKRQSIMDTYKEIKAAYSNEWANTPADKAYWVGTDENGLIKVTLDIHGIVGLENLRDVVATNSEQARVRYAAMIAEENQ